MSFCNLNGLFLIVLVWVYFKRVNFMKREEFRSYKIVGLDGL